MSRIEMWLRKSLMVAMVAALGLGILPLASAYAQTPNPPAIQPSTSRLQIAWSREQAIYVRIGNILDRASGLVTRIQSRLDEAKSKGKDVSSVQTALDAFSTALKNVQGIYAEIQAIVQSHAGFDASGNVTDPVQALQTVKDFRAKIVEIRQVGLREAGRALHEAIKALRQSNRPAPATPTSSSPNG